MKNLFIIYIGGSCSGALIELHDIRLVIAETIEDTYDYLKKSWWGSLESLHLEAWGILNWADGYSIEIVELNLIIIKPSYILLIWEDMIANSLQSFIKIFLL